MNPIEAVAGRLLPRREDLRAMLRLAGPVVAIQVGMMLMGVVDTIMVGHVSAVARGIQRGFLIALMIGVPATLLLLPSELFMTLARQPPEVIPHAAVYAL